MANFVDIKIIGFDDKASSPSGKGALMNMVLKLSANAPGDWSSIFNTAWSNTFNMMKRSAYASGDSIIVTCMPDELQGQINFMKDLIAQVNEAYKAELELQHAQRQAAEKEAKANADALAKLKSGLEF